MLRTLTVCIIIAGTLLFTGCFPNATYYPDDEVVDGDTAAGADAVDMDQSDPTDQSDRPDQSDDTMADDTVADDTVADDTMADDTMADDTVADDTVTDDTVVESDISDEVVVDQSDPIDQSDDSESPDDFVDDTVVVDNVAVPDTDIDTMIDVDTILPDADTDTDTDTAAGSLAIRFVAANLTSGNYQSYDPGEGIRLMTATKGDIFMVQEFNYGNNSASDYRAMSDEACGAECDYSAGTGSIPNGVISRWPITDSGYWDDPNISDRNIDWVRIDIPGSKDLLVVSVHLHTSPSSDQVTAAQVVAKKVTEHRTANPGCCYYVVGGDFNGPTSVSDSGFGKYNGQSVFYTADPDPVGEDGAIGTNASRSSQYDFVLLDLPLHAYQTAVVFEPAGSGAAFSYPSGLVFDSRDFSQSELNNYFPPAQTGDSGASNMQHMAIVKDVLIP